MLYRVEEYWKADDNWHPVFEYSVTVFKDAAEKWLDEIGKVNPKSTYRIAIFDRVAEIYPQRKLEEKIKENVH